MGFGTSRPIDAHQHSVFSGTSGLFQTASTSQGPATSRSQSSSSTFVEPIELEGLRSNPWAKPTSVELQSAFPDIRDRMQAIATSAEDFELDESAFMSNKSATRGSRDALDMSSLKSSLPTVDISQGENSKRRPSTSRRAGGVLEVVTAGSARNRTDTQRRIDFGIGFMGEFFVGHHRMCAPSCGLADMSR